MKTQVYISYNGREEPYPYVIGAKGEDGKIKWQQKSYPSQYQAHCAAVKIWPDCEVHFNC